MISHTNLALAGVLGLPTFTADARILYSRLTMIVRDGVIEHVCYPVFPPDMHAGAVVEWLRMRPISNQP